MNALFWRGVKDRRTSLLIYMVASIGFLEMYIALFPTLQKQAGQLSKLMDTYPESFFQAFNIDKASLTFENVGSYLGMEQFNFIWPIMMIMIAIGFANYAFVNEVERGTIEVILSQPISRTKIFITRYMSGLMNLVIFSFISVFAILPLAFMHGISVEMKELWVMFALASIFSWAIYSIAIFGSTLFSEKGRASFLTGGVLVLMYVVNIVGGLKENLHDLKFLSFFYYYNSTTALDKAQFVPWSIVVFVGVALVFSVSSLLIFNKRDIAV